jgi:threonine/homoserine/homoserine lactone efflux protein
MGEAIGQMLPFAFGVALSPMPIVAIVLMLITPKATSNGLSFLAGWVVGVAAAGAIVLAVVGPSATSEGQPEDWTFWLKLVLGVLLFVVGIREWRGRPGAGDEVELPKWMSALDRFTPAKAAGSGVLLSALNPKNLIFIVGGATVVAQAAISGGGQAVVWALFTLIASIGVLVPVAIYFALGERASALLDEIKTWMARNNAAVMAVLILVIGVKLIGDGIAGLSA